MTTNPEGLLDEPLHGIRLLCDDTVASVGGDLLPLRLRQQPIEASDGVSAWRHLDRGERYSTRFELYGRPQGWLLDIACEGRGRFLIHGDGIDIDWEGGPVLRTIFNR